ncbi:dual oxidase maturation factor 2 [Indicator indicator]|uniref:dual oxidase maturation factor 2 n=1 Tax=Indicator indicator TaxID=1002788 RepID=UPI0023DED145|nr:dual oxidase maturation factor 2 [Indicator indicator]
MSLFDGIYPFYPQKRKAAVFDISIIMVIMVFLTLACSFLLIIPGIRGRARLYWTLRVLLSLAVGVVIVVVQFTGDWQSGWVRANTSYKSFSPALVSAEVGVHVGLAGVNITLLGAPVGQLNETIDYNEFFSWGLGADYEQSYVAGLQKGLPSPILYVAEKFRARSPCGMQGQYRGAGRYASISLWVAFCTWLLSNLLFSMPALVYGGYILLLTGAFLSLSLLSFYTISPSLPCPIHFGPAALCTAYGGSFWLTLAVGLLCLAAGVAVVLLHRFKSDLLKTFFALREDRAEECRKVTAVRGSPHLLGKGLAPLQPSQRSPCSS